MWQIKRNGSNHNFSQALVERLNDTEISQFAKHVIWKELSDKQVVVTAVNDMAMRDHVRAIAEDAIGYLQSLLKCGHPLVCAILWGKGSTVCLVLTLEAMKRVRDSGYAPAFMITIALFPMLIRTI